MNWRCVFPIIPVLVKFWDFDWVTTKYTRMLLVSSTWSFTCISEKKKHVEPIICLVLNVLIPIWLYPIWMYTHSLIAWWRYLDWHYFLWMEFPLMVLLIIHIDVTLYKTFQRVTLSYEIVTSDFAWAMKAKCSILK